MKPLNTNPFKPLFAILTVALACVCMWGCSDDVTFEWENSRRNAKVVGFIDDSLVMVSDYRFWLEVTDSWNGEHLEDSDAGNPRLCVYNYRVQEDGPRWCDSVSELHSSSWFYGQLTDSVVWGSGLPYSIKLWKVWEKPHEIKLKTEFDGCSKKIDARKIHEWRGGKFIVLGAVSVDGKTIDNALLASDYGSEYCQYAILDTTARTITYKRLDKDLEWIKQCDDVRAWGNDVYCLFFDKSVFNAYVLVNSEIKDSLLKDSFKLNRYAEVSFIGNYMNVYQSLCTFGNGWHEWITSFSSQGISFGDGKGNYITY
ncbi:MAG: hypothetical protein IKS96_06225 [Fibrobacter sp.]|nr:hypothetical protein [Fibrobacter sp.]